MAGLYFVVAFLSKSFTLINFDSVSISARSDETHRHYQKICTLAFNLPHGEFSSFHGESECAAMYVKLLLMHALCK